MVDDPTPSEKEKKEKEEEEARKDSEKFQGYLEGRQLGIKMKRELVEGFTSPKVMEAIRLYTSGEDRETAIKTSGLSFVEVETFDWFLHTIKGYSEDMRGGIVEAFATCPDCEVEWSEVMRYCSGCGKENPHFDESKATQWFGRSYAEQIEEQCIPEFHEFRGKSQGGFCFLCGYKYAKPSE